MESYQRPSGRSKEKQEKHFMKYRERYNNEGYKDMTAFIALKNIERESIKTTEHKQVRDPRREKLTGLCEPLGSNQ